MKPVKGIYTISVLGLVSTLMLGSCKAPVPQVRAKGATESRKEFEAREYFLGALKERTIGNEAQAAALFLSAISIKPDLAAAHYELGRLRFSDNKMQEAYQHAVSASKLDPSNPWYLLLRADAARRTGQMKEATECLQSLTKLQPEEPSHWYELSLLYGQQKQYEQALDAVLKIESLSGLGPELIDQAKALNEAMGKPKETLPLLRRYVEAQPQSVETQLYAAQVYMEMQQLDEAEKALKIAYQLDPANGKVTLSLADLARLRSDRPGMNRYLLQAFRDPALSIDYKVQTTLQLLQESQADTSLQPVLDSLSSALCVAHPEQAKAFALRGDILARQEKNFDAIVAYRKSLQLDQAQPKYLVWQQLLLLLHATEQWEPLKKESDAALELFPQLPMPYYFRGAALYQMKQYAQSVQSLKNGLNLCAGDKVLEEQFCGLLGDAANQAGQIQESNKAYEKALANNPNSVYVLNNYAWHLALRKESLTKALEMSQKANNLEPGDPNLLDTQAWVYFQLGQYQEALIWIEKAIIASKTDASPGTLEHKGDILYKLNRADEAREYWIKAKQKGATNDKLLKKIESGTWVE